MTFSCKSDKSNGLKIILDSHIGFETGFASHVGMEGQTIEGEVVSMVLSCTLDK